MILDKLLIRVGELATINPLNLSTVDALLRAACMCTATTWIYGALQFALAGVRGDPWRLRATFWRARASNLHRGLLGGGEPRGREDGSDDGLPAGGRADPGAFFVTSIEINTVECCTHVTLFCETPTEGRREQRASVRLIIPTHLLPVMVGQVVSHLHETTAAAGRATTN
jgi:hypothetical protein